MFVYLIHESFEDWYTFDEVNGAHETLVGAQREVRSRIRAEGESRAVKFKKYNQNVWISNVPYGRKDSVYIERVKLGA
jgi:DNA gyrase/topoisomerase IV subunit A